VSGIKDGVLLFMTLHVEKLIMTFLVRILAHEGVNIATLHGNKDQREYPGQSRAICWLYDLDSSSERNQGWGLTLHDSSCKEADFDLPCAHSSTRGS
jgi:hypothetical protein